MITDFLALFVCGWVPVVAWYLIKHEAIPGVYQMLIPYILAFNLAYFLMGLYVPGVSPVDELRRLFVSTSIVYLFSITVSVWFSLTGVFSEVFFVLAWAFSLFLVPLSRSLVRQTMTRMKLWGEPVAIIGYGPLGYKLVTYLQANPMLGFLPYVVIDRRKESRSGPRVNPEGIIVKPVQDVISGDTDILRDIQTAILVTREIPEDFYESIIDISALKFARLIMVSVFEQNSKLWLQPYDIGGIIGLEVGQNLISAWQQTFKRLTDLFLIILSAPILLPAFGLVTLLIKLDSKGPVFYSCRRMGKGGQPFMEWKFRTMVPDADQLLDKYLEENPLLKQEWIATQKIKNDPRVTRVGRFLRKFSLDEFPQLWNVFVGEMSLVGPRPISNREIASYGKKFNLYIQVRPGMTGLWQVSGRSNVDYGERVQMDEYYVRNWSVWLDVIILMRTPVVVIESRGAY
jgi:Undecaprenyl-phosphate galactose phosphotransferase WbaP